MTEDLERIHEFLREKDRAREDSMKRLRLLVRTCGDGIRSLHRGERAKAEEAKSAAKLLLDETLSGLSEHPDLAASNSVRAAMAEYAELIIVISLLTEHEVPGLEEVGVPPTAYLGGVGDAVGEVRRHILNLLRRHQTREAEEYLELAENMYDMLMSFDYPKAIVGDLRRKQDVARSLLERTRADVTNAILQKELSDKLEGRGG